MRVNRIRKAFFLCFMTIACGLFLIDLIPAAEEVNKSENINRGEIEILSHPYKSFELVDVSAKGGNDTQVFDVSNGKGYHFVASMPVKNQWEPLSVTFIPSDYGQVKIRLKAPYYSDKLEQFSVWADDVEINGIPVKNAGFEDQDTSGKPSEWAATAGNLIEYSTDGTVARSGNCSLAVANNGAYEQNFPVEPWKEVTITVYFKDRK